MPLSAIFQGLGEDAFPKQLRGVSMGRLRTYQLFDRVKTRLHLHKLNTESLRNAAPRLWARLGEGDEELATDLAQAILVSNLDMIRAVLDSLGIPHNDGFFEKEMDASQYLTEGWQQRVFDEHRQKWSEPVLLFYLNHLGWELTKSEQVFQPGGTA